MLSQRKVGHVNAVIDVRYDADIASRVLRWSALICRGVYAANNARDLRRDG